MNRACLSFCFRPYHLPPQLSTIDIFRQHQYILIARSIHLSLPLLATSPKEGLAPFGRAGQPPFQRALHSKRMTRKRPYPALDMSRTLGIRMLSPLLYFKDANGIIHLLVTSRHRKLQYTLSISPEQMAAMIRAPRFTYHEMGSGSDWDQAPDLKALGLARLPVPEL